MTIIKRFIDYNRTTKMLTHGSRIEWSGKTFASSASVRSTSSAGLTPSAPD